MLFIQQIVYTKRNARKILKLRYNERHVFDEKIVFSNLETKVNVLLTAVNYFTKG